MRTSLGRATYRLPWHTTGGLIVGFLYDTCALDTPHTPRVFSRHLHAKLIVVPTTCSRVAVAQRGVCRHVAGLALVYNILLPTPPLLPIAGPKQKSEGLSAALCSAEFAGHAWTAFNMGWSMPSPIS
eukprot:scaffold56308_cov61-Phaeocystis_antarctica.AAC.4